MTRNKFITYLSKISSPGAAAQLAPKYQGTCNKNAEAVASGVDNVWRLELATASTYTRWGYEGHPDGRLELSSPSILGAAWNEARIPQRSNITEQKIQIKRIPCVLAWSPGTSQFIGSHARYCLGIQVKDLNQNLPDKTGAPRAPFTALLVQFINMKQHALERRCWLTNTCGITSQPLRLI